MSLLRLFARAGSSLISRGVSTSPCRNAELKLVFAKPCSVFYNGVNVKQVDVPGLTGAFGILAEHVPTISTLRPGLVAVTKEDGVTDKYFVSSGTVTVNPDSTVQVLVEEGFPLEMIDAQLVRDNLSKAQSELSSASTEEKKAIAQIMVEAYESMLSVL